MVVKSLSWVPATEVPAIDTSNMAAGEWRLFVDETLGTATFVCKYLKDGTIWNAPLHLLCGLSLPLLTDNGSTLLYLGADGINLAAGAAYKINGVAIGATGPTGPQGMQGPIGATGSTGPAGIVPIYNAVGNLQAGQHIVRGSITISSGKSVTLTLAGSAAFSSAASYFTMASITDGDVPTITQNSGNSITFAAKNGDVVNYVCIGD